MRNPAPTMTPEGFEVVQTLASEAVGDAPTASLGQVEGNEMSEDKHSSHRETDDAYSGVVARLSPDLRVIVCKGGIQWIAQRLVGGRWRWFGHTITRKGLINVGTRFLRRHEVEERLSHLPDYLRRPK